MSNIPSAITKPSARLTSLDQFRGYTMFGMLLVNFLGGYEHVCPRILRHTHDYCSYADTIMPQFLFAAGFALRLSLGKRYEAGGKMPWGRAIKRILGLALVAIAWYSFCSLGDIIHKFQTQPLPDVLLFLFKRELFATLLHIAVTSLWILPVITAPWTVRLMYAIGSGILHIYLSWWFNFSWVYADPTGVDGGPLGILTWSVPALCGTLACDAVRASGPRAAIRIAFSGLGVMLLGWVMSCGTVLYNVPADQVPIDSTASSANLDAIRFPPDPVIPTIERLRAWDGTIAEPPFVPPPDVRHRKLNYWMMGQRPGTLSYTTFGAGVSLVIYALCLWICDGLKCQLAFFRTLGTNSLAAYILHDIAGWFIPKFFPESTPSVAVALAGFACFTLFVYGVCRWLERMGWYIRV